MSDKTIPYILSHIHIGVDLHNLISTEYCTIKEQQFFAFTVRLHHGCTRQRVVRLGKVCTLENPCESSMKNSIGKPYEREVHVRFDEGGADSSFIIIIFKDINFE